MERHGYGQHGHGEFHAGALGTRRVGKILVLLAAEHPAERTRGRFVERRGQKAARDVDNAQEAGQSHRRVTESHYDYMSRQPYIGIQHRSKHFQRIAVQLQIVGNQKGDKTDGCSADTPNPVLVKPFQEKTEKNRTPANKKG